MAVYRAPSGNFISFLSGVDNIIRLLYKAKSKFIICGDINIDYSLDSDKKRQLDAMHQSYNLSSIVHFHTRVHNQTSMTNNIFIDIHKITSYTVCPLYNGLSVHDAQLLTIKDGNSTNIESSHLYY
jgi:exonuclease III